MNSRRRSSHSGSIFSRNVTVISRVNHEVKDNVVQCLGTVGYMMGQEAKRFCHLHFVAC